MPDNRCAKRTVYDQRLSFSSGNSSFSGQCRDISTTGLFIETLTDLDAQIEVTLTLSSTARPLRMSAMVTRKTKEGVGAYFEVLTQSQILEFGADT